MLSTVVEVSRSCADIISVFCAFDIAYNKAAFQLWWRRHARLHVKVARTFDRQTFKVVSSDRRSIADHECQVLCLNCLICDRQPTRWMARFICVRVTDVPMQSTAHTTLPESNSTRTRSAAKPFLATNRQVRLRSLNTKPRCARIHRRKRLRSWGSTSQSLAPCHSFLFLRSIA